MNKVFYYAQCKLHSIWKAKRSVALFFAITCVLQNCLVDNTAAAAADAEDTVVVLRIADDDRRQMKVQNATVGLVRR